MDSFKLILESEVSRFKEVCGYPGKLFVSDPYLPYVQGPEAFTYSYAGEPGCYVFVSGEGEVIYIGKASRRIGSRIWAHIGRAGHSHEDGQYPYAADWMRSASPPVSVYAISVEESHWWMALALEGFLTERLLKDKRRI